jgi:hypothetical protein
MDAPMDAADSARDLLRKRLMRSRMQQIEDSLARQQEIDTTPAPLLYEGYNVERQQARVSTDGGEIHVPVITNGAIAEGSSIIGSGGVIEGRPRVITEETRSRTRTAPVVACLFEALQKGLWRRRSACHHAADDAVSARKRANC